MNTKIYLRGSAAYRQPRPRRGKSKLGGSRTNWHHTSSPHLGAVRTTLESTFQATISIEFLFVNLPRGLSTKTPHNHLFRAGNNHQSRSMNHCFSKPFRWRQPPRVTRVLATNMISSATRCLNAMQMH
jgi:hypothetical protein